MNFLRTLVMATAFVASLNSFSSASDHPLQDDSQPPTKLTKKVNSQEDGEAIRYRTNKMLEDLWKQLREQDVDDWHLNFYKKQFSEGLDLIPLEDREDTLQKVIGITSQMKKDFCSFSSLIQATQKISQEDRNSVLNHAVPFINIHCRSGFDYIPLIISTIQAICPDERRVTLGKAMPIFKSCPEYFKETVTEVKSIELSDIEDVAQLLMLSPKYYLSFNGAKHYYNAQFRGGMMGLFGSFIRELSKVPRINRRDVWLKSRPLLENYRFALNAPYVEQLIKAVSEVPYEECEDVFENVDQILRAEPVDRNPGLNQPLLIKQINEVPKGQRQAFIAQMSKEKGFSLPDKTIDAGKKVNGQKGFDLIPVVTEDGLKPTPLYKLPAELITYILWQLPDQNLVCATSSLARVSKRFHAILTQPSVWDQITYRLCLPYTVKSLSVDEAKEESDETLFSNLVLTLRPPVSVAEFVSFKDKLRVNPTHSKECYFSLGRKSFSLRENYDLNVADITAHYNPAIISFAFSTHYKKIRSDVRGINRSSNDLWQTGNSFTLNRL